MKFRGMWLPLVAALALPGALRAQDEECPCRDRPGMIGISFDTEGEDEGVRIVEVRRGSPAAEAGLRGGDVVVRLDGRDAGEAMDALPGRLQAGDTVRLRIRRDGDERDVVVVAEPREPVRFGVLRPGIRRPGMPGAFGENVIIINGDSVHLPLEALTFRIDSLRTQLQGMDGGRFRVEMDSLVRLFTDSAGVWTQRMPEVRFQMHEPLADGLAVAGAFDSRPFFMELGRRAAAGAELAEMNEGLSRYFGGQREGALVIEVSPESPAARAGLEPGDVIVRAAGEEVSGPEDVRDALNAAEEGRVSLEVVRQGRRRELSLEWTGERVLRREYRMEPSRVRPRVRSDNR